MIFKTSESYQDRQSDSAKIKEIEYKIWQSALEVKNENGKKEKFKVDSTWGYQTEKCVVARWIKEQNTFFYIKESKGIVVYLGRIKKGMRNMAGPTDGRGTTSIFEANFFWGRNHHPDDYPFFSKTLDSEPMPLNWQNLKESYKEDACFLKKLDTIDGGFKEAFTLEKDSKKLKINILYKECHTEIK